MSIRRTGIAGDKVAVLQRAALQDRRLSYRARGVLCAVLSRPADWKTSAEQLCHESPSEGRDALRTALKELETHGYLVRRRVQGERGRWETCWDISDDPATTGGDEEPAGRTDDGIPAVGGPAVGGPAVGESGLLLGVDTGGRDIPPTPQVRPSPADGHRDPGGRKTKGTTKGKPSGPSGTDGHPMHAHHDHARRWAERITAERRLPITADEVLAWCYRAGAGDPWTGHRVVDSETAEELDTARRPLQALRARLRKATGGEESEAA